MNPPRFPLPATVAICTYNGSARIGQVIAALARQTQDFGTWELLVIDNASKDGTDQVCQTAFQRFPWLQARLVREEKAGLAFARMRATSEARGEVLCFLDDDTLPSVDFVAAGIKAFSDHPRAGVLGGKVLPLWEIPPTPLAQTVAGFALAICDLGEVARRRDEAGGGVVGAGLSARTALLKEIYALEQTASRVSGRKGGNLMSGEDLVISVVARQLGWETWYVPTLVIQHILPAGRMEKGYLHRLYEGIGRGQAATRTFCDWKARSPLAWMIGVKDYLRWLLGQWRGPSTELRRRQPELAGELHELDQCLTLGRARQALRWPN